MNSFKKTLLAIILFLALLKVSSLGAVVMVCMCVIKCMFKSRAVSHLAALIAHDFFVLLARGFWWVLRSLTQGLWNSLRVMSRALMRWVTNQTP